MVNKEDLMLVVSFIQANRDEMGDKQSLDKLLKALDNLIKK